MMEIVLILFILSTILGLYSVVTGNVPTMKSLRNVPAFDVIEAKKQGHEDMRKAVESSIVEQDYVISRQAIEDEYSKRMKAQYEQQSSYSSYSQSHSSSMSKSDALEALDIKYKRAKRRVGTLDVDTVASFMVKWESTTGKPYPFDPSAGQSSEYHFGAEPRIYDTYIAGGREYLDELDEVKSRVVTRTCTIKARKTGQGALNRQWQASNEARHMLQIEAMSSAQEKFDAEIKRIEDSSRMIEGN